MAEAARIPYPDRYVSAVEEVGFHAPFKFYRDEPRTVTVTATYSQDGDDIVAECRLVGSRQLVGRDEPEVTVHFTGRVRLSPEAPEGGVQAELPEAASEVTTIPVSMTIPIRLWTFRDVPVSNSVGTTPMIANGTETITIKGSRNLSNWAAITM